MAHDRLAPTNEYTGSPLNFEPSTTGGTAADVWKLELPRLPEDLVA